LRRCGFHRFFIALLPVRDLLLRAKHLLFEANHQRPLALTRDIRCNAIAPGTIDTPYFDEILKKSAHLGATRKALAARQLLGRLGTPEEIAAGILFSCQRRKPVRYRRDPHLGRMTAQ